MSPIIVGFGVALLVALVSAVLGIAIGKCMKFGLE